jgi:hypothetical protein
VGAIQALFAATNVSRNVVSQYCHHAINTSPAVTMVNSTVAMAVIRASIFFRAPTRATTQ